MDLIRFTLHQAPCHPPKQNQKDYRDALIIVDGRARWKSLESTSVNEIKEYMVPCMSLSFHELILWMNELSYKSAICIYHLVYPHGFSGQKSRSHDEGGHVDINEFLHSAHRAICRMLYACKSVHNRCCKSFFYHL
jgi:hypothetical protein